MNIDVKGRGSWFFAGSKKPLSTRFAFKKAESQGLSGGEGEWSPDLLARPVINLTSKPEISACSGPETGLKEYRVKATNFKNRPPDEVLERSKVRTETIAGRERDLREMDRKFHCLVENIDLGIAWIDLNFRVILHNSAMGRLCGQPGIDFVGRHCHEIFWDEEGRCTDCPGTEAMATGKSVVKELELKMKSGKMLQVRVNVFPTFAEDGSITGFVKVEEDISRQKMMEGALLESEKRFELLADACPFMIWLSNRENRCTFVNKGALEFTGRTLEQDLDRGWTENLHPDDLENFLAAFDCASDQRGGFRLEFRLRRADGSFGWALGIGNPRFHPDGSFAGYIGSMVDITDHREMEDQLRVFNGELEGKVAARTTSLMTANLVLKNEISERKKIEEELHKRQKDQQRQHEELNQLFRLVRRGKKEWESTMDCVKEVVVLVDREGRIRRCNKALVALTGKGFNDLLGREITEVLDAGPGSFDDLFLLGGEFCHQLSERWFLINNYRMDEEQIEGGAVITLYDYTNLKLLTCKLQDSNRMLEIKGNQLEEAYADLKTVHTKTLTQEKMAIIGQLAAGVAHEINNPIGFVSSNLRSLQKYLGRLTDFIAVQDEALQATGNQAALEAVGNARKQLKPDFIIADIVDLIDESLDGAERVRKIVQDLKTFSRVDDAEWKFVDLIECLESTINMVWNEIKYKATLVRAFAEMPQVRCNPHQLNQVFMNLLINAAQAIEKEGQITVKAWQEGETVLFSVTDTGCGIPQENLRQIFEAFFTTKEVGKGTGLGLSVSYEIVKKHRGEIFVDSEPGKGTTFTVRLPIDAREESGEGTTE